MDNVYDLKTYKDSIEKKRSKEDARNAAQRAGMYLIHEHTKRYMDHQKSIAKIKQSFQR